MIATSRHHGRPLAWALLTIGALSGGCSVLFHSDASQCSTNGDCVARGPAFAQHVCVAGTCVPPSGPEGGATADAKPGSDAGGEAQAGCTSNSDCLPPAGQTPPETYACDVASGACLQLTSAECPYVIGDYSGKIAQPLYIGAFATLPPNAPQSHPSFLNYQLVINEFASGSGGGIPGWDPVHGVAGLRMPVAVICNAEADADTAMDHLKNDVHVPAVVAALDAATLREVFVNDAYPDIFVVNPFGADSTLTSIPETGGMLWHMLGQPSDNAPAYQAFFPELEAYVRSTQHLAAGTPVKVASVTGQATDTQDLAAAVQSVISWNGVSLQENETNGNYMDVSIPSVLDGTTMLPVDVSGAVSSILSFAPNVIISFASSEFVELLQTLELELQSGQYPSNPPPFYLVGPYNMDSTELLQWIGPGNNAQALANTSRVAGVGVASATDTDVLQAYETRFLAAYNASAEPDLGQENYYDAMYFAIYSVVGAGRVPNLSGPNLAQGMLRLLSGPTYDMGPSAMGDIFGALGAPNGTISLLGTLGPPDFTISTGARIGQGDIYCINTDSDSGTPYFDYDVLRLTSTSDGGTPELGGTFPCYSGL